MIKYIKQNYQQGDGDAEKERGRGRERGARGGGRKNKSQIIIQTRNKDKSIYILYITIQGRSQGGHGGMPPPFELERKGERRGKRRKRGNVSPI